MPYSAFVNEDESKTMTLREASLLSNPSNKSTSNKCHCKSKCNDDKRHSCLNCTNHCHPGRTCSNNCDETVDCLSIGTNTWHNDLHMSRASQILKKCMVILMDNRTQSFNETVHGSFLQTNLFSFYI